MKAVFVLAILGVIVVSTQGFPFHSSGYVKYGSWSEKERPNENHPATHHKGGFLSNFFKNLFSGEDNYNYMDWGYPQKTADEDMKKVFHGPGVKTTTSTKTERFGGQRIQTKITHAKGKNSYGTKISFNSQPDTEVVSDKPDHERLRFNPRHQM